MKQPSAPSPSLREQTYDRLKDMILSGKVRPSTRLSEHGLSRRLGVSRTPLREALMKLEKEGLVTGERNVGYAVADLDVGEVCELLEVRKALDAAAAELACLRAGPQDIKRIEDVLDEMVRLHAARQSEPEHVARELELGLDIHRVIARAAGNEALVGFIEQIYQKLRMALWLEVLWIDLGDSAIEEHRAIAQAIVARDPKAAADAARAHVESSLANMEKVRALMAIRHVASSPPTR